MGFESKKFFSVFVGILPLRPGSTDSHYFADTDTDTDPRSQNLADPDLKQTLNVTKSLVVDNISRNLKMKGSVWLDRVC